MQKIIKEKYIVWRRDSYNYNDYPCNSLNEVLEIINEYDSDYIVTKPIQVELKEKGNRK